MTIVVNNIFAQILSDQVWFENSNMSLGRYPKSHGCQQPKKWPSLQAKEVALNTFTSLETLKC